MITMIKYELIRKTSETGKLCSLGRSLSCIGIYLSAAECFSGLNLFRDLLN
jgi:hypothetical protein